VSADRASVEFAHTQIYAKALVLVALAKRMVDGLPPGHGYLGDQVRRASASVVLNFTEGYGKPTVAEQRRYFQIARASALECVAIADVSRELRAISVPLHAELRDVGDHLGRMLARFRAD
jgi:four helix bundle protein